MLASSCCCACAWVDDPILCSLKLTSQYQRGLNTYEKNEKKKQKQILTLNNNGNKLSW